MTRFSITNLIIFVIALFLLESLLAEEIIIPKPEPKIEEITKKEIILPKTQPGNDKLQKEEISQIDTKPKIDERLLKKMLLPKIKPINYDSIKLEAKKTKYLLPKKKPEDQIIEKPIFVEKGKESENEKK